MGHSDCMGIFQLQKPYVQSRYRFLKIKVCKVEAVLCRVNQRKNSDFVALKQITTPWPQWDRHTRNQQDTIERPSDIKRMSLVYFSSGTKQNGEAGKRIDTRTAFDFT